MRRWGARPARSPEKSISLTMILPSRRSTQIRVAGICCSYTNTYCPSCKRVRNDHSHWHQMGLYIEVRLDRRSSLGLCPACAKETYRHQV